MTEKENSDSRNEQNFLNTLFHELKIPVSSISGYLSLLLSGDLGKFSSAQLKVVQKTKDLSLYINEIINNISSMSRLGNQRAVHYEKVSIAELVKKAVAALNVQITAKKLKIHIKSSKNMEPVWVLPLDVEQVIINILSNAVKFTPKSKAIYISADKTLGKVCLELRDTGIGIPEQAQSKIFEDFYRADNVVRQYEGCGLGLSIVKRILSFNKGSISISSKINKGTTVKISLPLLTEKDVFESELKQYILEASSGSPQAPAVFSLLMLVDIKNKKPSNLYKIMQETLRRADRIFSLSKEKYIAILPGADYNEVRLVCERLKSALEENAFSSLRKRGKGNSDSVAAVSFAVFPSDGSTSDKLLSRLEEDIKNPVSVITIYKK